MPIHDWTRVDAGLFHDFHQRWIAALSNALNVGGLPPDYFALVDQRVRGPIPDVLTLKLSGSDAEPSQGPPGLAVATAPPRTRLVHRKEVEIYAARANRLTIRHRHGDVVAVIEIVSPGNKGSRAEFRAFVEKSTELLRQGIHLLIVDLFPPHPRDSRRIHEAIWDEFEEERFEPPADKPLTLASYDAGPLQAAYVEFVAVGDPLPDIPLFLQPEFYVPTPLETTYQATWELFPAPLKPLLEVPAPRQNPPAKPTEE
ncbi:MAG TPA: DUF4058 family protein [Gemmataceae bacterium]|jgi:hypothetical protein